MVLSALLLASATVLPAQAAPTAAPPSRASTTVMVRIVRAAEIRDGRSDAPHRRRIVSDPDGAQRLLLEFE